MQSVLSDVAEFKQWYQEVQNQLKGNNLAKFFNEYRRVSTHVGEQLVGRGASNITDSGDQVIVYFFHPNQDLQVVPTGDVLSLCTEYFIDLLKVVFDCYEHFKYVIDAKWYYTSENFKKLGKTIEDAEEELGFPRGWTDIGEPSMTKERWKVLRSRELGCEINHIFDKYLGKTFLQPEQFQDVLATVRFETNEEESMLAYKPDSKNAIAFDIEQKCDRILEQVSQGKMRSPTSLRSESVIALHPQ